MRPRMKTNDRADSCGDDRSSSTDKRDAYLKTMVAPRVFASCRTCFGRHVVSIRARPMTRHDGMLSSAGTLRVRTSKEVWRYPHIPMGA